MNILYVCTGNTCRSAMAECITEYQAKLHNVPVDVSSAGISAFPGQAASENAIKVMSEYGLVLRNHISRQISEKMLSEADLILTMTKAQKGTLISNFPVYKEKIFTLTEYVGDSNDILDPFGSDIIVYRECAMQLTEAVMKLLSKVEES